MAHDQGHTHHRHHHGDVDHGDVDHADVDHGDVNHAGIDWAAMASLLEGEAELYTPLYTRALAWLAGEVTGPGLVVDAGSGPGVLTRLLADAFPDARVVAADGAAPLLDRARARAARHGFADRFDTLTGELPEALGALDHPADLLWASRSLHHLADQRAGLAAFAACLAPGGTLALLEGGLPVRFLPRDIGLGRPGLQARLDAAREDAFTRMRQSLPGSVAVTEDWPALLTAAGLRHTGTRSFLLDLPAPASDAARAHVAATLARLRHLGADAGLDAGDRATLDRLVDPDDEAGVHRRPDLFLLAAHTVHTAVRAG